MAIDYIGGWNERGYDKGWFGTLHAALASNGYATKVVGTDNDWGVVSDLTSDSAFRASVDVVGVHYPCGGNGAPATSCPGNSSAIALGVPLWASENGSQDYQTGAPAMARAITRGYVDARMTSYINWPLVAALAPNLPFPTTGLLVSDQPWSGAYDLGRQLWVSAHVTQFTQPGWSFIDGASGYLGGSSHSGSYVSLKSKAGGDYSVVVETTGGPAAQTVPFSVTGGLSTGGVRIWTTDLGASGTGDSFVHGADVTPDAKGAFWVALEPDRLYTISTTQGQCKGDAQSPPRKALALPYAEDFEASAIGTLAPLLGDQDGAFETAPCGGGRAGHCYREATATSPIGWATPSYAYALLGTNDWSDYTVAADVLFEQPGSAELIGRFGARDYYNTGWIDAYYLSVTDAGAWTIFRNDNTTGKHTSLAQGSVAGLGTNTWHSIALSLKGSTVSATIDGAQVGTATDATFSKGPAGLSVGASSGSWLNVEFDNLRIDP